MGAVVGKYYEGKARKVPEGPEGREENSLKVRTRNVFGELRIQVREEWAGIAVMSLRLNAMV
jgi:hypothetical protein